MGGAPVGRVDLEEEGVCRCRRGSEVTSSAFAHALLQKRPRLFSGQEPAKGGKTEFLEFETQRLSHRGVREAVQEVNIRDAKNKARASVQQRDTG